MAAFFSHRFLLFFNLQEIDMINLFGSPAGRAINKITSIKLSKSEAAAATAAAATTTTAVSAIATTPTVKMKSKSKDRINHTNSFSCNSSGSSSFCYRGNDMNLQNRSASSASASTVNTNTHPLNRDHTVFDEDQENSIKAISGTVGINTTFGVVGINNNNSSTIAGTGTATAQAGQTIRNRRYCIASKPEKYINLHKKKVKCWEFLENDKLNNNWRCTSSDEHKVDRFDELIT